MSTRSRSSLGGNPIICWSVLRSVSTPRGMRHPQPKKTAGTFRPLERGLKRVIRDIGRGTGPPHDQPPLIEQQTEFAPDNPAMVGQAFAPDLLRAAPLAHGMDQLDAVGVDDAEHGRSSQESPRPVVMGLQKTKEPGALGEVGK